MSTQVVTIDTDRPGVPLGRLVKVELRKMFDTRSGFWLMMSIAIVATIATVVVILVQTLNDNAGITYGSYGGAVGFPMAVLLPIIAILAVTGEWSQRTGLITFTLVPHRASVIAAKALAASARWHHLDAACHGGRCPRQRHRLVDRRCRHRRGIWASTNSS